MTQKYKYDLERFNYLQLYKLHQHVKLDMKIN